ncbi:unnamed protein product [Zymoseptoria tritici ST99CH_3D7]|uniref:Glutaminase n=1 Tax=Zymoseptoria tritici (strain ST99CH_3D7) TaxID=1276538 RepID=A0A1X7RSS3_ZYMT9|nr:unnamed protein product [Zymoseptoria tritici ST99CH_3D7]
MMAMRWLSALVFWLQTLLFGQQVVASIASLPSYPLAVKSPYLSTWLPSTGIRDVANAQPEFWTGQQINWPVLARVDGKAYALLNSPAEVSGTVTAAKTLEVRYSSTHTWITLGAGEVNFTLAFFSPVYPRDLQLQSLPYSYLTVKVDTDQPRDIEVFSAIDQTWTQQNGSSSINYTTTDSNGYFRFFNKNQTPFQEVDDMAAWGSVIFGTTNEENVTHASGPARDVLSTFIDNGDLAQMPSDELGSNIAGLAKSLGRVGSEGAAVTFGVGFQRDLAIEYLGEVQTGYHRTMWPEITEAFEFFMGNYKDANDFSEKLDRQVRTKAESMSDDWGSQYADICEASVRQCLAAYELTVPLNNLTAEPWAFLKEISSDGNINTIDLIFQTWPIFVSLNPEWIKLQLLPVLNYHASGRWPKDYTIHDIGTHYPYATGHDDGVEEDMPLFETSSMLILLHAYEQFSNSTSLTDRYASLLPGWADYLVSNALYPSPQLSSVDAIFPSANQTGLAIQSAIALQAAARLLNNETYSSAAKSFSKTLYDHGLGLNTATPSNNSYFTYNYDHPDSWSVLFPAFSDILLNLSTFPPAALYSQNNLYLAQLSLTPAGLPFAHAPAANVTGVSWALTDWNIVYAAASGSEELKKKVVESTWSFLTNGLNRVPFGTKYVVEEGAEEGEVGEWIGNKARSTVGGHFAILAVEEGVWEGVQGGVRLMQKREIDTEERRNGTGRFTTTENTLMICSRM